MKTFVLYYESHYLGGTCVVKADTVETAIGYGNHLLDIGHIGDCTGKKVYKAEEIHSRWYETNNGDY